MFIDASAIVAILGNEADRRELAERLEKEKVRMSSTVALFEAVLALSRKVGGVPKALAAVEEFVRVLEIRVEPVKHDLLIGLADTHAHYGKGSGHPARLNMGDCFSYAMAKGAGMRLLYKGDDFVHTDLA